MTERPFILHYFLLNKWSYLVAVACIVLVNWLQVEIPRYIQRGIDRWVRPARQPAAI